MVAQSFGESWGNAGRQIPLFGPFRRPAAAEDACLYLATHRATHCPSNTASTSEAKTQQKQVHLPSSPLFERRFSAVHGHQPHPGTPYAPAVAALEAIVNPARFQTIVQQSAPRAAQKAEAALRPKKPGIAFVHSLSKLSHRTATALRQCQKQRACRDRSIDGFGHEHGR